MLRIVVTVKKDQLIELAVHKNNYKKPNIKVLTDNLGNAISKAKESEVWFSTIDFKYAYSQLSLDSE